MVEDLIRIGNALARSIGHNPEGRIHCPKLSPAVPCTCGASAEQAKALDEWIRLVNEIEKTGIIYLTSYET